jgi:hypothetical protein
VRVGVVAAWNDLGAVRRELPELIKEHKPKSLGWFPSGPAAALMADMLTIKGTKRVELKGVDVHAGCRGFAEEVSSRQLVHGNDPLLNAHVLGSQTLPSGDGWRFQRRGGNVDAAYAAAGAVHLAWIASKPQGLKLVTESNLIGPPGPPAQSPCAQARVRAKVQHMEEGYTQLGTVLIDQRPEDSEGDGVIVVGRFKGDPYDSVQLSYHAGRRNLYLTPEGALRLAFLLAAAVERDIDIR